jgi:hypothetical protein
MSAGRPAWPYCYQCDGPTVSACARCGRFFCPQHGGERLGWRPAGPGLPGRFVLRRRPLCDECRPNRAWIAASTAGTVALAVAGGLATLWLLSRLGR